MQIDGVKARVLIDTGCTTDMISLDVLGALDKLLFELSEPVGLQLATKDSKTKINYGYSTHTKLGGFEVKHYLDVANLDKYDVILGTPFLHKYTVAIVFDEPAYFVLNGVRHIEGEGEFGIPKLLLTKTSCRIINAKGVELKTPATIAK